MFIVNIYVMFIYQIVYTLTESMAVFSLSLSISLALSVPHNIIHKMQVVCTSRAHFTSTMLDTTENAYKSNPWHIVLLRDKHNIQLCGM